MKKLDELKRKIFTDNVGQIFVATCQILNVGMFSVNYFVNNMPKEFGQQGAVTIVLALIALSIGKIKYEKLSSGLDTITLNEKIRLNERLQAMRDDSLDRTFNIHASQIAQVAQLLNIRTGFNRTDEQFESLLVDVETELANEEEVRRKHDSIWEEYHTNVAEFAKAKRSADSWSGLLWKLEIAFVAIGTLQNAYGPDIVTAFHAG